MMDLGKKLEQVRRSAGLSQSELVNRLMQRGFDIKKYTVSKWESGASRPSVEAFLAVCDICGVDDIRRTFSELRRIRLYDIPVSAGHGSFLGDSDYETVEADSSVPDSADFAVRVSGDSMNPRFIDGQVVFVHGQDTLSAGEIGIFFLNGEVFLKKLGDGCLISLNSRYAPIRFSDNDEIRVIGKVVG